MLRQWLHGPHHLRPLRARLRSPPWHGAVATRAESLDDSMAGSEGKVPRNRQGWTAALHGENLWYPLVI